MSEQIKKYTKRPVTVEAVQFTDIAKDSVWRWANDIQMNVYPGREDNGSPCLRIPTKEGEMTCSLGDWLIREPFPTDDRKLYPCKLDIFEQTYQPTPEPSEQIEKLTLQATMMKHGVLDGYRNVQNIESAMKDFAAQQVEHATAELRKELEGVKMRFDRACDAGIQHAGDVVKANYEVGGLRIQLAEAQRQRDEADNLLSELYENGQGSYGTPLEIAKRVKSYLDSRLLSGETKPNE